MLPKEQILTEMGSLLMMKLLSIPILAMIFIVTFVNPYAGAALAADKKATPGRVEFLVHCATCHGIKGKGDGTVAEFLTLNPIDLTQLSKRNGGVFPRERTTSVIDGRAQVRVHGPRDMPVWGDQFKSEAASSHAGKAAQELIVKRRIKALVDYLETIQQK
jgi:mono/diheme cytochrome c family protein